MNTCKRCNKQFEQEKGLINYCSLHCRNGNVLSKETKDKISKILKQKYATGKLIANMSGTQKESSRAKQAKSMTGKKQSEKSKIKKSISCKNSGCGYKNKGKKHTDDFKRKCRIRMIEKLKATHQNFHPGYNKKACEYFDKLMLKNNINIKHALNGGELHLNELGYWVDGYDEVNNVIYEFDERRHYDIYGNLSEKDKIKQKEIEQHLNCKFIRIKWCDI